MKVEPVSSSCKMRGKPSRFFPRENTATRVDKSTDAGVGGANHGAAEFNAAKNGVVVVMNRFRTFAEPAVIAHIDHDLRTVADELPGVPGDGVFETDQGNDSDSVTVLLKDEWFKRRAGGEVLLNDATGDPFEERKFAAERDVFPKPEQGELFDETDRSRFHPSSG